MSIQPGLTIVTVLYGGAETLEHTLPTWAAAAADLPVSFLFVDNSDDGAAHAVVVAQPWRAGTMRHLFSGENSGFAAGANRAIREAGTDTVFLLNPDVAIAREDLAELLSLGPCRAPRAISLITDGRTTAGVNLNAVGWFSDRPLDSTVPCLGPSGGAAMFDRAQFLELGGFTDELFAWGEDAALALRLWSGGVVTEVVDLRLRHSGGHSVSSIGGLRKKALWLARNRVWILRAQYSRPYQATFGLLMFGMLILNGLRKVSAGTGRAYFRGVIVGVTTPPPWHVSEVMTVRSHLDYRRRRTSLEDVYPA